MVKCPFCHFDNEDGALFCEQCKSDLAGVEPITAATPIEAPIPLAAAIPVAAEIVETLPVMGVAEVVPMAEAYMAEPMSAIPIEAIPLETISSTPMAAEVIEAVPIQLASELSAPLLEAAPTIPIASIAPQTMQAAVAMSAGPPTMPGAVSAALTAHPASAPTTPAAPPASAPAALPPDAQPRLVVLRGLKRNVEYPIYEGANFIGRADEKPVDIDLDDQEPPDRVWSSRQHAVVTFEHGQLVIEDLNSSNGTFVNRARIYPGQKCVLAVNDVVQIGTVQMKVIA